MNRQDLESKTIVWAAIDASLFKALNGCLFGTKKTSYLTDITHGESIEIQKYLP